MNVLSEELKISDNAPGLATPGVKQEPPLPVTVEVARDVAADASLAEAIRDRLRSVLVVQTRVELVPWGTLQRSEYKAKLVQN